MSAHITERHLIHVNQQSNTSIDRHSTMSIDTHINEQVYRFAFVEFLLTIYFPTNLRLHNTGDNVF